MDFGGTPSQIVGFRGASFVAFRLGTILSVCRSHANVSLGSISQMLKPWCSQNEGPIDMEEISQRMSHTSSDWIWTTK